MTDKPKKNLGPNFNRTPLRKYSRTGDFSVTVIEDTDAEPTSTSFVLATHPTNRQMVEVRIGDRTLVVRRDELSKACGNLDLCD